MSSGQAGGPAAQDFGRDLSQDISWSAYASTCSRSNQVAAVRAALIALILLGILALVVLF